MKLSYILLTRGSATLEHIDTASKRRFDRDHFKNIYKQTLDVLDTYVKTSLLYNMNVWQTSYENFSWVSTETDCLRFPNAV